MNANNLIFITSWVKNESNEYNRKAFRELLLLLEHYNYPVKICKGYYKNMLEPSIMVNIGDNHNGMLLSDISFLTNVANVYKQESILLVNRDNSAFLVNVDKSQDYLGKFKQTSKFNIDRYNLESYTKIDNNYYVA